MGSILWVSLQITGLAPRETGLAPRDTGLAPRDTGLAPRDTDLAPRDYKMFLLSFTLGPFPPFSAVPTLVLLIPDIYPFTVSSVLWTLKYLSLNSHYLPALIHKSQF